MPPNCQVIQVRELNGIGADGRVQSFIELSFKCGDFGPFTQQFPKAGFSARDALAKIEEFARDLGQLPTDRP